MENRFGFFHFIFSVLLILLIVVVCLGMQQLDRQWTKLRQIQDSLDQQTKTLAQLSVAVANAPPPGTGPGQSDHPGSATVIASDRGDVFAEVKAAEKQPDFARGDWFIDNMGTKVGRITPMISSDLYAIIVDAKVVESLVVRDPMTLEYVPQLAHDWKISDDGLTFTFYLRRGVTFSDGEPFTADDVVFSYQIIMDPKIDDPRDRAYLDKIKSVQKVDDYTVVFKMTEPYFDSMSLTGGLNILPRHFYSKYTQEQINQNPGLLMGTGPYKLRDPAGWIPGQLLEVIRNDRYWGPPPTFNRLVFHEVEEEAAEEAMYINGELDQFAPQPEQYVRMLKDKRVMDRSNHYEYSTLLSGYSYIAWNEKRAGKPTAFADPKVRTAMTLLTDRQRICQEVYLGYAQPISGPFSNNSPQADPSIKPLPYDPAAAAKLLAEAGYAYRDNSGVLEDAEGKPLRIKLSYGSGNATFERIALFLKDTYAKAGVTLQLDPVDWPLLVKKLDERDFEAVSLGWGGAIESDLYQEFDSSQIPDRADNFMSYSNPDLDRVVRQARKTVDDAARMKLWHEAHRILARDQPYTFLLERMSLRFIDKRIKNVEPSKVGLNYVNLWSSPIPWYVPKALQKYAD